MTTTTIEAEATTRIPAARPQAERAVFVTDDDYRSRRLSQAAIAVGALACLWFTGLGIGTLGLGGLPEVSLSIPGRGEQPRRAVDPSNHVTRAQARPTPRLAAARESTATSAPRQAAIRPESSHWNHARAKRPITVPASHVARATPTQAAPGSQPAQPITPEPIRRGLERRGLSAPPGEAQRETRPQPPAAPPGETRRAGDPETTSVTVPPGQQKPDKPPPSG
jgi:hypothetical protein